MLVTAATLAFFPVLYFFSFLYYTDAGSTFFVLLLYLLSLRGKHFLAGIAGMVAILFRQTNIVWVIFSAGLAASHHLKTYYRKRQKKKTTSSTTFLFWDFLPAIASQIIQDICVHPKEIWKLVLITLKDVWSYLLILIGFLSFVFINGSIVVGAKNDHSAGLHFCQLFYFASFAAAFSAVHLISFKGLHNYINLWYRKTLVLVILAAVSAAIVWQFTYEHRYLLADNRHYPFYVWSKIYRRHISIKYLLIPAYFYAIWSINASLKYKDALWKFFYIICLCANLVPSTLLEFRYFILPYLIYRLNIPVSSDIRLGLELFIHLAINIVTLYIFMDMPFAWPDQTPLQRFMW